MKKLLQNAGQLYLAFSGLSTNLSYGAVSLLYSGLIAWIKLSEENLNEVYNQDTIFVQALGWFPGYFLFTIFSWWYSFTDCVFQKK